MHMKKDTDRDKKIKELWIKYSETKSQDIRNEIIIEYANLVKIIASRLSAYLGNCIEYEELVSYGTIGLINAVNRYDISMNVKFETYASMRIKGEMIDQLRKSDWVPRVVREKEKKYNNAYNVLYNRLGREPTNSELQEELGMSEKEFNSMVVLLNSTQMIYMDDNGSLDDTGDNVSIADTIKQDTFESPEKHVLMSELKEKLELALDKLTERERKVIELYYYNDLSLTEISKVLNITGSRASQLHSKAIVKIKDDLKEYKEIFYKNI